MMKNSVKTVWKWVVILAIWLATVNAGAVVPDDFPRFIVPAKEREMESLRSLFWLHYEPAKPLIPLWDDWLPNATLWPALGERASLDAMRDKWRRALAGRKMNDEGYIHTEQHDGLAHAEGWPFPLWTQAGGVGWHFRGTGIAGYDVAPVAPEGWNLERAAGGALNDKGWPIELSEADSTALTPAFAVEAKNAPWLRLNWWASGLARDRTAGQASSGTDARCYVEWTTREQPEFSPQRRMYFSPPADDADQLRTEARTMIPAYRDPHWTGVITGMRIGFGNSGPARVVIKSFHTACDTRHNVNNLNFIRGCYDYTLWTGDLDFLCEQIGRIRAAMRFVEREFRPREKKCIYTTWPGHEGRSGVQWVDGKKQIVVGEGVGSNYWDLLPFGGEDALATVYYYDTLCDLAAIEEIVAAHPEWKVPADDAYDPPDLRRHAEEVKDYFGKRFWNAATDRFGTVDLDGQMHDYGFTFLNNEAVVFGITTPAQAESIQAWMSGARTVDGDTSTGADIYHWRFGPRSTTRRNIDYYFWGWSNPESIPWGYQVQDGGAVLGWSYYDLMARLKTGGQDDAAARLAEIAAWFDETRAEGGYRAYYGKNAARGTMQGGNVPGGLGLDKEFYESVLVPQVMLYGFLGFRPTLGGFAVEPRLPSDWPELTITRIHLHDWVLNVTAARDGGLKIVGSGPADKPVVIHASKTTRLTSVEGVTAKIVAH
jgi:hypothetical protein